MNKKFAIIVTGLSLATLCTAAVADPLPKSGSISLHAAFRAAFEILPVADKHGVGHGDARGVTFNDKGSGPLHLGPLDCTYASFIVNDTGRFKGYCAYGDADGDRFFTDYIGTFSTPMANPKARATSLAAPENMPASPATCRGNVKRPVPTAKPSVRIG